MGLHESNLYCLNIMLYFIIIVIIEEFKRAVLIATGGVLGDHIVNIVFQLFDIDGMLFIM